MALLKPMESWNSGKMEQWGKYVILEQKNKSNIPSFHSSSIPI